MYIVRNGCASKFQSLYAFGLLTHLHPDITIEWRCNEVNHGKSLMDGISGTVKNLDYVRILSGDVFINTPREFTEFADRISSVD